MSDTATLEAPPARSADYSEAFSAIDDIPGDVLPEASPKAAAAPQNDEPAQSPAPEPTKPTSKAKIGSDLDQLEGKAKAKEEPAPKPKAEKAPSKEGLKEFREQYELTKKERDELKKAMDDLKAAQADGTKKQVEEATKALRAEMDAIRKRAEETEQELKFTNFTRSREYREQYEEPWGRAWKAATEYAAGVEVEDQATGETRKANYTDIMALTRLPEAQAEKIAHAKFGANAIGMLRHRATILDAKSRMDTAVEEWKSKGMEREKQLEAQAAQRSQQVVQAFDETMSSLESDYPVLFGREDKDDEGNSLLDKGDALIRAAFRGEGIDPEMSDEDKTRTVARIQAEVAARAKAFGRERLRSIRLAKRIEELEAKLKKVDESEPRQGGGGDQRRARFKNPEDAIDELND